MEGEDAEPGATTLLGSLPLLKIYSAFTHLNMLSLLATLLPLLSFRDWNKLRGVGVLAVWSGYSR